MRPGPILLLILLLADLPAAAQDNPFGNDGELSGDEPPRARLKPDHVRLQVTARDCRRLVAHRAEPGVAYEPGIDVRGDPVAPADLPGSTDLGDRLMDREIAFDLELNPLLFAGNPDLADLFGNATVDLGRIVYDPETDEITLDGEALTDPQTAAIRKACRERLQ